MITVLPDYSIVSVGPNASLNINSGPIAGKILIGLGSTTNGSGNGVCSSPGTCNANTGVPLDVTQSGISTGNFGSLNNPQPTINNLNDGGALAQQAFNEAATLSNAVAGFSPTQTFASLPNANNPIIGNGGLNVINVTGNSGNPTTVFQGTESDFFVINLFGNLSENNPMTLNGVDPAHILWNFVGTGTGNRFTTSGGGVEYGTFLAANQLGNINFQFSNLNLTGALWNTSGNIQFVSGSQIVDAVPFLPAAPVVTAEPASLLMLGVAFVGIGLVRKKIAGK
jgi:hypothetical protein